jgi:hypothetical protein
MSASEQKNVYPESPEQTREQYSVATIVLATFLGTLVAGTVLVAVNFKRLQWPRQARATLSLLLLAACTQLWIMWHSPPDLISQLLSHTLVAMVGAYLLLRVLRGREPFVCNTKANGAAPRWHAFVVGFVFNLAATGLFVKMSAVLSAFP